MIDYNKDVIYNGHIYKVKDILFEALIYGYSNNTKKNSYISWIFYRRYSYTKANGEDAASGDCFCLTLKV